jgi:hypothetical protein
LKQGTIFHIPKETFKTNSKGCITIKVAEFYKFSDILMENLSTTSNGDLLETAGMIDWSAFDDFGNELSFENEKKITIMLPTDSLRSDMQLFEGERDPHSDVMNWLAEDNQLFRLGFDNSDNGIGDCERCRVLFCRLIGRIDETTKGAFKKSQREENRVFRECQRKLRANRKNLINQNDNNDKLMDSLGVKNYRQLKDTLLKIRMAESLEKLNTTGEGMREFSYYVFNTDKMGWINCDAFAKVANAKKTYVKTNVPFNAQHDAKLVFRSMKSVMPGGRNGNNFGFVNVPFGMNVIAVGLKFEDQKIYFGKTVTRISYDVIEIKLNEVSLEELKVELEKLNL